MSEVLDDGFHLVVSEQVDGVPGGVESLIEVRFERMHNKAHLEICVGSEHLCGVNFPHLQAPGVEDDHSVVQVCDIHVSELRFELRNGFLSEVALNEEITICNQEVGIGFLDVAFEWLLQVLADFVEVTALVKHFGI